MIFFEDDEAELFLSDSNNIKKIRDFLSQNPKKMGFIFRNYHIYTLISDLFKEFIEKGTPKIEEGLIKSLILKRDPIIYHSNFKMYLERYQEFLNESLEEIIILGNTFFFPKNTLSTLSFETVPDATVQYIGEGSFLHDAILFNNPILFQTVEDSDSLQNTPFNPYSSDDIKFFIIPGKTKLLPMNSNEFKIEDQYDFKHITTGYNLEGEKIFVYFPDPLRKLLTYINKNDGLVVFSREETHFFAEKSNYPFEISSPNIDLLFIETAFILPEFNRWNISKMSYLTYEDENGEIEVFRKPVDLTLFLKNMFKGRIDIIENAIPEHEITPRRIYTYRNGFLV